MRAGERVRVLLLVGCGLTFALSLAAFAYGAVLLSASDADADLVSKSSPTAVTALLLLVLVLQMGASAFAFHASLRKLRARLERYFAAQIALGCAELGLFMYVLLAGNGVLSGGVSQLTEDQERLVTLFALENPVSWKAFQDEEIDGRNCCGLNARSTYLSARGGFPDLPLFENEDIFSGAACEGSGLDQLEDFKAAFPIFNASAADRELLEQPFNRVGFICFDRVVSALRAYGLVGGVLAGVVLFLGAFSAGCAATLLYSVKETKGGLKPMNSFVSDAALANAAFGGKSKFQLFQSGGGKKKGKPEKSAQVVMKFDNAY